MQVAEFATTEASKRAKIANATTFVRGTLKNFGPEDKPIVVNTKKYSIYNKSPNALKLFSRAKSGSVDIALSANALDVFTVSFDHDAFAVVLSTGSIEVHRVQELADQSLATAATKLVIPDNVVAAAVVNPQAERQAVAIVALASSNIVYLVQSVLDSPTVKPLGSLVGTSAAPLFRAARQNVAVVHAHGEAQVFEFDGETGAGWKSALAKPWFPHGDESVTGLHVFSKKAGSALRILTGCNGNNELRLWSLEKGAVSLVQTINIKHPEGAAAPRRHLLVDFDDGFVYLPAAVTGVPQSPVDAAPATAPGGMVVFAMDDSLKAVRGTEWNVDALVHAAPAFLKVKADNGETRYERALVCRTPTEIFRSILEARFLEGAPNLSGQGAASASAAVANPNDVRRWFDQPAAATAAAVAPVAAQPPRYHGFVPQVTEISSNGTSTTTTKFDAALVEKQLRDALRERDDSIAASYSALNEGVKQLERLASQTAAAIRQPQIVQRITQDFARKAASQTFETCRAAAGNIATGAAPPQEVIADMRSVDKFCEEMRVQGQRVASTILAQSMQRQLTAAVERSWATVMGPQETKEILLPKPTQLPSLQEFCDTIDKAHATQSDLFRRQKEADSAKIKSILSRTVGSAEQSLANNRAYFAKVKVSLDNLGAAVKDAGTGAAPSSSGAMTEDAVVAAAVKLAEAGRWKESLKTAVDAGKPAALVRYLESDIVSSNKQAVASETTLSVPVFVSVMQQLSTDLRSSIGLAPTRIGWMLEFVVAFDHQLQDERNRALLSSSAVHFSNILDSLGAIDDKGDLDVKSRRNIKLVRKALQPLAF